MNAENYEIEALLKDTLAHLKDEKLGAARMGAVLRAAAKGKRRGVRIPLWATAAALALCASLAAFFAIPRGEEAPQERRSFKYVSGADRLIYTHSATAVYATPIFEIIESRSARPPFDMKFEEGFARMSVAGDFEDSEREGEVAEAAQRRRQAEEEQRLDAEAASGENSLLTPDAGSAL